MNPLHFDQHPHHTRRLIEAALEAVDPATAVKRNLTLDGNRLRAGDLEYDLRDGRVFVVAAGKAARAMGTAAAAILGDALAAGILIGKRHSPQASPQTSPQTSPQAPQSSSGELEVSASLVQRYAGHPVPDQAGVSATAEVVELLARTEPGDLVLCLISGGASALLTQPTLPLDQWGRLVDALLASGCTINELNAVRKRFDRVKGGGLARLAAPATCASLILSDVVGNPLDVIGSGPTVANPDDPAEAGRILRRYGVAERLQPEDWAAVCDQLDQSAGKRRQI